MPIRSYLDQTVVPLLLEGLAEVSEKRPAKPIEYLADYLEKHNTERKPEEQKIESKSVVQDSKDVAKK